MTAKRFPEASGVNTGAKGLILGIKIPEQKEMPGQEDARQKKVKGPNSGQGFKLMSR